MSRSFVLSFTFAFAAGIATGEFVVLPMWGLGVAVFGSAFIRPRWFMIVAVAFSLGVVRMNLAGPISSASQPAGIECSAITCPLARLNIKLQRLVTQSFRTPQSSLLSGILLGAQRDMPTDLRQAFRLTGTSHIIALSGFNVTIIVAVVTAWLGRLLGRKPSVWPSLLFVVLFVVMTGASASVVRAAIMAAAVQLALLSGRPVAMDRLLAYTFVAMVAVKPTLFLHDLGFQLSFLATIGLVYASPRIAERLGWVPAWGGLRENLATTLAAMCLTEPLLLATFGRLSLIAPLVNILVLPLVPLAMAAGAVFVFLRLIWLPLAGLVVPLTDVLLRAMIGLIEYGSRLPAASATVPPWLMPVIGAGLMAVAVRLIYAPKPAAS